MNAMQSRQQGLQQKMESWKLTRLRATLKLIDTLLRHQTIRQYGMATWHCSIAKHTN
jgi:hypothetical protein